MLRLIVVGLLCLVLATPAFARNNGQYAQVDPKIGKWIGGLTDRQGRGCCATADGFQPEEVEWDTANDRYRVRLGKEWYVVPDYALITEPNLLGYAVVWYYVEEDAVYIRCFIPGAGG